MVALELAVEVSDGRERSELCLFVGVELILLFNKLASFFARERPNRLGVDDSGLVAIASASAFDGRAGSSIVSAA